VGEVRLALESYKIKGGEVENINVVKEKKGRKTLAIPESVVEEMDIGGGDDEFGMDQRTEVLLEFPGDALTEQVVEGPV